MTSAYLLVVLPAAPLASAVLLWTGSQRLSSKAVQRWAVGAVFLTGTVSLLLARPVLAAHRSAAGQPVRAEFGRWIEAGRDLVELTVAAGDLPAVQPIPATAVTTSWWSLDIPGLPGLVAHTWDPRAVVGERPLPNAIAAGTPLTRWNVPPGLQDFQPIEPRRQHGFEVDAALACDVPALATAWLILAGSLWCFLRLRSSGAAGREALAAASLSLLLACSLLVVLTANLVLAFVGWACLGLASGLGGPQATAGLIAARVDRRSLMAHRTSDALFLVAAMLTWCVFGSLSYLVILPDAPHRLPQAGALAAAIGCLFLLAAVAKGVALYTPAWVSSTAWTDRGRALVSLAMGGPAVGLVVWRLWPIVHVAWTALIGRLGSASVAAVQLFGG